MVVRGGSVGSLDRFFGIVMLVCFVVFCRVLIMVVL